ncbi:MAG: ABC transporter ATP-binding protein [Nitrososphaerota archaeon]
MDRGAEKSGHSPSPSPKVEMRGIVKRFPGVLANDNVDFTIYEGEVHALLGENGAGKTTLMNILYGIYTPDSGTIRVRGVPVKLRSPRDAIKLGIGMVHQDFRLIEAHTVVENVFLNHRELGFVPNWRSLESRLEELASNYGWKLNPRARVGGLSPGEKQQVELLKLLVRGADILLLDEPTSVLTPIETRMLFKTMRRMVEDGKSVVLITHKLSEALSVSDRITVMRRGRVVLTRPTSEVTIEELSIAMVGTQIEGVVSRAKGEQGEKEPILKISNLSVMGDSGVLAVRDVNLTVYRGEILCIAGVSGNGQVELVEAITGLRKPLRGKIILNGLDIAGASPRRLFELGLSYIPPEGKKWGIVPELSIYENVALRVIRRQPYSRLGMIKWESIIKTAQRVVTEFRVDASSVKARAGSLSGGNVQRLILGRELTTSNPLLLVAAYPTKGLDIAATEQVKRILLGLRDEKVGILMVSEDLDEVLELSDRIAVMYGGRIVGVIKRSEASAEVLGSMMSRGVPVSAAA